MTATRKPSAVRVLRAKPLERVPWLVHGFSTRPGGVSKAYGRADDLNLGFTKADARGSVERNRRRFLDALGAGGSEAWPLVTLKQVHSDVIHRIDKARASKLGKTQPALTGDGLVTNVPGVLLAIQAADCLPVLVVDPEHRAVGAFHAGWRGTLARIVEKGVGRMRKEFGSDPDKLLAAIGPGVGVCCYAVGAEVRDKFESQFPCAGELFEEVYKSDPVRERYPLLFLTARAPGHSETIGPQLHLDLAKANRRQLEDAGVPPANITGLAMCTACKPKLLFSYRAQSGKTGRLLGAVGIRPKAATAKS
ncbi:MAG: peptidoglycan editing factor PgeF [Acidobacteriota bacterium]|nr:peptidoglycan editing factor PgeF [Acidobacteriota bacterium]